MATRSHRRKIAPRVRAEVYRRAGHRCEYCGLQFDPTPASIAGTHAPEQFELAFWLELDHIVPVLLGGLDTVDNLRAACSRCNRSRGVDAGDQWATQLQEAH